MEHKTSEGWNVRAGRHGERLVVVTVQPAKNGQRCPHQAALPACRTRSMKTFSSGCVAAKGENRADDEENHADGEGQIGLVVACAQTAYAVEDDKCEHDGNDPDNCEDNTGCAIHTVYLSRSERDATGLSRVGRTPFPPAQVIRHMPVAWLWQ